MIKRVLLVDDEEEIVSFMERFLKRFKIVSIKATSGEQALQLYDKDTIDFVFLDIRMGGMDGFTVLKEIKRIHPAAKVIVIAGNIEKELAERAIRLGAIDVVSKPLDLSELKDIIEKYVLQDVSLVHRTLHEEKPAFRS